jgi:hypothetical protein
VSKNFGEFIAENDDLETLHREGEEWPYIAGFSFWALCYPFAAEFHSFTDVRQCPSLLEHLTQIN